VSVASHLSIDLDEYDARIRTFIPYYEEMLAIAAGIAASRQPRVVVDLGVGTGALAAAVARQARSAAIVGIDEDEAILAAAARRLRRRRARLIHGSFLTAPLPACDAITASFALHHVASSRAKRGLFRRACTALGRHGVFVSADCHPSASAALARDEFAAWRAFLRTTYGPRQAETYLAAWAKEDFYTALPAELLLLRSAGLDADVVWRRDAFAVVAAEPRRARPPQRSTTKAERPDSPTG
jgi:SAM-dependent methyltransferase